MHISPKTSLCSSVFKVGNATVRARFDGEAVHFEWDPDMPKQFNRRERRQYRRGRNELMTRVMKLLGHRKTLVVEL